MDFNDKKGIAISETLEWTLPSIPAHMLPTNIYISTYLIGGPHFGWDITKNQ